MAGKEKVAGEGDSVVSGIHALSLAEHGQAGTQSLNCYICRWMERASPALSSNGKSLQCELEHSEREKSAEMR